jgi:RNA polymerase sigma-70 factor (ECF subfamily)
VTLTPAASLERLYLAHRDAVVRYLRSISAGEDEAFDTAAVVFERAFAVIGRDPEVEIGLPWLLRTARNAAIDQRRRRKVRQVAVAGLASAAVTEPGPEAGYLERERALAIRAALARLPDHTRDAIVLRYGLGLPARTIGEVIGRREDATQKLITRGLARLREVLDERP